ncbi:hypothetical protein SUGI_0067550 [Cryptomeria japonica]|nr:hypothetical protein SUGI_0067550 [Cryptomeria japonica]
MRILTDSSDRRDVSTTGKPPMGFPFGTAVILFLVLGISALFSCCYHWEKIRNMHHRRHYRSGGGGDGGGNSSLRPTSRSSFMPPATAPPNWSSPSKNTQIHQSRRSLPVMMPGDDVPKFLAMPSPHGFAPQNIGGSAVASSQTNQSKRIFIHH